jgi:hypothetical protein
MDSQSLHTVFAKWIRCCFVPSSSSTTINGPPPSGLVSHTASPKPVGPTAVYLAFVMSRVEWSNCMCFGDVAEQWACKPPKNLACRKEFEPMAFGPEGRNCDPELLFTVKCCSLLMNDAIL